jgi:hypothetical protein
VKICADVLVLVSLIMLLGISGCKEADTPPIESGPYPSVGDYSGLALISGSYVNVKLEITEDSLHSADRIVYAGEAAGLSNVYTDSEGDTLWFTYLRGMQQYRVWAGIFDTGLDLHYLEPTGFPSFAVNRQIAGYNLTGRWTGQISSEIYAGSECILLAEQRGNGFAGNLTASFVAGFTCQFTAGSSSGAAFSLSGTGAIGSTTFPVTLQGQYSSADQIHGTWSATGSSYADHGDFVMERAFN